MNPVPHGSEEIVRRLDAIETALAKLSSKHSQALEQYWDTDRAYRQQQEKRAAEDSDALRAFRESDERYKRELESYASERSATKPAVVLGMILRVSAVALLAYIAWKV